MTAAAVHRAAPPEPRVRATQSPWLLTVWGASLVAVGSLGLAAAWHHWLPAVVLVVAAVLPLVLLRTVVSLGISRWAASSVLSLLLLLAAYLMAAGSGTPFRDLVADSVPLLLTEPQPYDVRADLLVAPVLLTGLLSLFAGLRLESRTRVGPLAAALALYVCGALLSTGTADRWGLLAVLLVVLGLLGWVLLDEHTEPTVQRLAVAGPSLVVLVGGMAAAALLPSTDPFEPRGLVDPPMVVVEAASPLPQLGAWQQNPDTPLLRVAGDRVPLRLVTLDQYDGAQWRAATRYAPFGTIGEPVLPPGDLRRTATVAVAFEGLGGRWLPAPGDPVDVSSEDAVVDPRTGTLYDPEAGGETAYEVTAVRDAPEPEALVGATVPGTAAAQRFLTLPELPLRLASYAEEVVAGAHTPYEQAMAIESAVKQGRTLSGQSISGSAYWRIDKFLFGEAGTSGAQVGTSEQFATAFTVLARHAGLPTRMVVGFKPGDAQTDGSRIVRGSDALAWPEVYFDRLGWVPFSPTPKDDTFTQDRPEVTTAPPVEDQAPLSPGGSSTKPDPSTTTPTTAGAGPEHGSRAWWPWIVALSGGPLVLLVGARRVRSLRHRRRGAPGAWAEVLDALALAGTPAPRSAAATAIADGADRRWGTTATRRVADLAERVAFGPSPFTDAGVRAELREVRRAARRSAPWWRRLVWSVDPRVFRR
ncbi:DUF3488 and transglutaminase-like domain-containing protein [Nocardioides lianchengensis]|uniref:Transglutaminase-like enzyme, putative cysteine protease n=1 Tax=Nocardioides lianchengensis TaxID=1045774 RepID=A0A1G6NYV2_9ACTN|nr:transglutaminase domain-containing protein [Nocardioides lianchengensis]NYG10939.1 transglutaminase-like putative cysteine protease [Nocardioides lianchengensis]SDC72959.1 Transglutaminase-like enzyme, putative cysteine protease [Nocardioides lianchengensis]